MERRDGPETTKLECGFCRGVLRHRYAMGEFSILECCSCATGCALPLPSTAQLHEFYSGFHPSLLESQYQKIRHAAKLLYHDLHLHQGQAMRMLDVGGGGGYFAKAFEDLGFGEADYVDVDAEACEFAKSKLKLKNVFCCDVEDLPECLSRPYSFIYARHLIEHLPSPLSFMEKMVSLLEEDGIFVVHCPNGRSLEYFAYPRLLRARFNKIVAANRSNYIRVIYSSVTKSMHHGMDPPRHLWTLTKAGLSSWARSKGIQFTCVTRPMWNTAYSPYFEPRKYKERFSGYLFAPALRIFHGGAHLVAVMRRPAERQ